LSYRRIGNIRPSCTKIATSSRRKSGFSTPKQLRLFSPVCPPKSTEAHFFHPYTSNTAPGSSHPRFHSQQLSVFSCLPMIFSAHPCCMAGEKTV